MRCKKCITEMVQDNRYLSNPPKVKYICPNCEDSIFENTDTGINSPVASECEHDFYVALINGEYVSVCRRCGKIGDRLKIF